MDSIDYIVPAWAYVSLVNSDESGLSDEQSELLDSFSNKVVALGYSAIPLSSAEHIGFLMDNELDGLGGECYRITFQSL